MMPWTRCGLQPSSPQHWQTKIDAVTRTVTFIITLIHPNHAERHVEREERANSHANRGDAGAHDDGRARAALVAPQHWLLAAWDMVSRCWWRCPRVAIDQGLPTRSSTLEWAAAALHHLTRSEHVPQKLATPRICLSLVSYMPLALPLARAELSSSNTANFCVSIARTSIYHSAARRGSPRAQIQSKLKTENALGRARRAAPGPRGEAPPHRGPQGAEGRARAPGRHLPKERGVAAVNPRS